MCASTRSVPGQAIAELKRGWWVSRGVAKWSIVIGPQASFRASQAERAKRQPVLSRSRDKLSAQLVSTEESQVASMPKSRSARILRSFVTSRCSAGERE